MATKALTAIELKEKFLRQVTVLKDHLTGKEITAIHEDTGVSKSTIYSILNGAITNLIVAEQVINSGNLQISKRGK